LQKTLQMARGLSQAHMLGLCGEQAGSVNKRNKSVGSCREGGKEGNEERVRETPSCTCAVEGLETKGRITNLVNRWSIGVRYTPRDTVVDADAQMKEQRQKLKTKEHYKSKPPRTSHVRTKGKSPNRDPTRQHWPMNEFFGNGCWKSSFHVVKFGFEYAPVNFSIYACVGNPSGSHPILILSGSWYTLT